MAGNRQRPEIAVMCEDNALLRERDCQDGGVAGAAQAPSRGGNNVASLPRHECRDLRMNIFIRKERKLREPQPRTLNSRRASFLKEVAA